MLIGLYLKYLWLHELKPVKLRLKIDLVSYPARAEGLVKSTSGYMLSYLNLKTLTNTTYIWRITSTIKFINW